MRALLLFLLVSVGSYAQTVGTIQEGTYQWVTGGKYFNATQKLVVKKLNDTALLFVLAVHTRPVFVNATTEDDVFQFGIAQKQKDGKWIGLIDERPLDEAITGVHELYYSDKTLPENTSRLLFHQGYRDTLFVEGYGGSDVFHGTFSPLNRQALVRYSIPGNAPAAGYVQGEITDRTILYNLPAGYLPQKEKIEKGIPVFVTAVYLNHWFVVVYNRAKRVVRYGWVNALDVSISHRRK